MYPIPEGATIEEYRGTIGRNAGLESESEPIDPIRSAEKGGQVREVQPDVALASGDLGWVGPRLIDCCHDGRAGQRVDSDAEPYGVAYGYPQLPCQLALHRHLNGLRSSGVRADNHENGGVKDPHWPGCCHCPSFSGCRAPNAVQC